MAKIIPINALINVTASPLTSRMIKTLKEACEKQNKGETFGQADLNGSFMALLKRGHIDCKQFTLVEKKKICWYVTRQGIKALQDVGVKETC